MRIEVNAVDVTTQRNECVRMIWHLRHITLAKNAKTSIQRHSNCTCEMYLYTAFRVLHLYTMLTIHVQYNLDTAEHSARKGSLHRCAQQYVCPDKYTRRRHGCHTRAMGFVSKSHGPRRLVCYRCQKNPLHSAAASEMN